MFTKLGIELKQTAFTLTLKLKLKPTNNNLLLIDPHSSFLLITRKKANEALPKFTLNGVISVRPT